MRREARDRADSGVAVAGQHESKASIAPRLRDVRGHQALKLERHADLGGEDIRLGPDVANAHVGTERLKALDEAHAEEMIRPAAHADIPQTRIIGNDDDVDVHAPPLSSVGVMLGVGGSTVGLLRSRSSTSRHRPCRRPIRSRSPTTRKPAR
jgi:hypothetical protein